MIAKNVMAGAGQLCLAQPMEPTTRGALDDLGMLVLGNDPAGAKEFDETK